MGDSTSPLYRISASVLEDAGETFTCIANLEQSERLYLEQALDHLQFEGVLWAYSIDEVHSNRRVQFEDVLNEVVDSIVSTKGGSQTSADDTFVRLRNDAHDAATG